MVPKRILRNITWLLTLLLLTAGELTAQDSSNYIRNGDFETDGLNWRV